MTSWFFTSCFYQYFGFFCPLESRNDNESESESESESECDRKKIVKGTFMRNHPQEIYKSQNKKTSLEYKAIKGEKI